MLVPLYRGPKLSLYGVIVLTLTNQAKMGLWCNGNIPFSHDVSLSVPWAGGRFGRRVRDGGTGESQGVAGLNPASSNEFFALGWSITCLRSWSSDSRHLVF